MWCLIFILSILYFKRFESKCTNAEKNPYRFTSFFVEYAANKGRYYALSDLASYGTYTCPSGSTLAYIKTQEDWDDWLDLRSMFLFHK